MIKLRPFKQKTNYCGPATLKIVLDYYGIRKSEHFLAKLAKCKPISGTPFINILEAARKLGLKGYIRHEMNMSELKELVNKKQIPVMINWLNWLSGNEMHYSIIVEIDRESVIMFDPEIGHLRSMKLSEFKSVWYDFPGGVVSKENLVLRPALVIHR